MKLMFILDFPEFSTSMHRTTARASFPVSRLLLFFSFVEVEAALILKREYVERIRYAYADGI